MVYLEVFGQPIVMLNSQAALDLLEKRGSIYSDRPHMAMASDLYEIISLTKFVINTCFYQLRDGRPHTYHALWGEVSIRTKADESSSECSLRFEMGGRYRTRISRHASGYVQSAKGFCFSFKQVSNGPLGFPYSHQNGRLYRYDGHVRTSCG